MQVLALCPFSDDTGFSWGGGATGLFPLWSPAGCAKVLPSFQVQAGGVLWHLKGNSWSLTGDFHLGFP